METIHSSETSVYFRWDMRRHISGDRALYNTHLRPAIFLLFLSFSGGLHTEHKLLNFKLLGIPYKSFEACFLSVLHFEESKINYVVSGKWANMVLKR
jgi:hypothetical protein